VRIVVVDDHASQLAGRLAWLSGCPGVEATGLTFEQAAAYDGWVGVHIAVLDGHDRRSPERRRRAAADAGVPALPEHDNFVGARVAEAIRRQSAPGRTTIIMISAHARDSDVRARRIAQAGVDYVFEHYEVDRDEQTFVQAVLHPETIDVRARPADWRAQGYHGVPDVAAAVAAVEESPAGHLLINDAAGKHHRDQAWAFRTLRGRLQRALRAAVPASTSFQRAPQAPRKEWLRQQLRQAFGRDLPTDPPS
jgi:CheY-like chemotaxis protein